MPPNLIDLGYAAKLPPEKAIAFFAAKGYAVSWNWWEVWASAHARAFTVAKAVQADVLESIRGALDEALADGRTRREFARDLEPRLRALGWWGRQIVVSPDGGAEEVQLGSPHRLRTIFDSNMRSTFGAARQRQQLENADSRPFWMYDARNDGRVRPSHAAMDGRVFRHDDPIWKTHYPPNGWNCRCRVRALTAAQVRARGLRVSDSAGSLEVVQQEVGVDKRTGEVVTKPGTAYRFRAGGEVRVMTPDPGWGAAPRGLSPAAAAPAPAFDPDRTPPAAARQRALDATADARRQLAAKTEELRRLNAEINDPATATTSMQFRARQALWRDLDAAKKEIRTAGRRALLRSRPAAFQGDSTPSWERDELERRWGSEMDDWRRLAAPRLVREVHAPRIVRHPKAAGADGSYVSGEVRLGDVARTSTLVHELSHLLEADRETLDRAVAFLARRTRGDPIEVIDGYRARRDQFVAPTYNPAASGPDPYPGRLYEASAQTDAEGWHRARLGGDLDVYATEVLSRGMQWMWTDPAGFVDADPDYFDFIWDTVVRGTR